MSHGSSHVWPQAQITPAQVIPFESHLILALGYKLFLNHVPSQAQDGTLSRRPLMWTQGKLSLVK